MGLARPSEVLPFATDRNIRSQCLWLYTAILGDCICGTWSVFISFPLPLESLRHPRSDGVVANMAHLYLRHHRIDWRHCWPA